MTFTYRNRRKLVPSVANSLFRDNGSESSLDFHSILWGTSSGWAMQEDFNEVNRPQTDLSRTELYILDYRQFKAARVIQKYFRGWFARHMYAKKHAAATKIQAAWRGFSSRRKCYQNLENYVKMKLEAHYFRSAQRIQALWRGWWVRRHVHDHTRMLASHILESAELLSCVAYKLHYLLRTYQIPGVYSLRNTHCLSRIEKLLAQMSFKQQNDRVRILRKQRAQITANKRKTFGKSKYATESPFEGPNYNNECADPCYDLFKGEDADRLMFKVLSMYEKAGHQKEAKRLKKIKSKDDGKSATNIKKISKKSSAMAHIKDIVNNKEVPYTNFCSDIITSMKRWDLLADNNVSVRSTIFENPQNVESFLTEIQSLVSLNQAQCFCALRNPSGCEKRYF